MPAWAGVIPKFRVPGSGTGSRDQKFGVQWRVRRGDPGSECVVQATAHDVRRVGHVERVGGAAARAAGGSAEIDVEIFEFRGPVAEERVLDAGAGVPADRGAAEAARARDVAFDVAKRHAAGEIRK